MGTIQSPDSTSIHCEIHGNGPVNLIFLHGWGGDGTTWNDVISQPGCARYRSISMDLRGHGKSGVPGTGYAIKNFSEDVLALADHFGAKKFVPVGFSMGGKLACYLAATHPERVSKLVLIAPAGPGIVPIDRELGLQGCRQANDWRKNEMVFKDWFAPGASAKIVKECCQTIARTPVHVLEATAELFLWTSLADDVGKLKQPTLQLIGEHDPVYGMAYQGSKMLPFLDNVATATVDSGHFIPLEQPARVAGAISKFMSVGHVTCSGPI